MAEHKDSQQKNRLFFLDNLKTFIIFLVAVYHAGYVYEGSGMLSSVWIVDDPAKNALAGQVGLVLDMFMMPVMFFISGFFSPASLQKNQGFSFIRSRFKRLIVPWIIAVLILIPLYHMIYLYSRGLPQENPGAYFHFNGGMLMNQGWLWFLPVLFLFDILYFLISKANLRFLRPGPKTGVALVFVVGLAYSFFISIFGLSGWTKTMLIDFQNERLLIYFLCFLLGALFYRHGIFARKPGSRIPYYIACGTIWIPMNLYVIFLINLLMNPGHFIISLHADLLLAWTGLHLTLLGMLYILVNTFRFYINRGGSLARTLSQCSYGVYIIHYIVLGGIALLLLNSSLPSMARYFILIAATFIVSNLLVYAYKKLWAALIYGSGPISIKSGLAAKPQ